jgi:hypothetical protein
MDSSNIQYVRLSLDNVKELPGLFKEVFGISFSKDYFVTRYFSEHLEKPCWGYLAKINDEYVGFSGGLFRYFEGNGKRYVGIQSVDAVAKAKSRGHGIFKNILTLIHEDCLKNGYDFIYGFPNPNSYKVMVNKMGFEVVGSLELFRYNLKGLPISKIIHRIPFLTKAYTAYTNRILSKYEKKDGYFPNSAQTGSFFGLARSERYIQYKLKNGNKFIVVENIGVWVKCSSRFLVGDIEINPEVNIEKLLSALKKIALSCGADQIDFKFSPGTFWYEKLSEVVTPQDSHVVIYRPVSTELDWNQFKYTASDFDMF